MKKRLLCIGMAVLLFTGCSSPTASLLTYEDVATATSISLQETMPSASLFAKDLCVISEEEASGGDVLMGAEGSMIANVTNKEVIYADNIYEKLYPASITKIVTALLVLKKGNLSDVVTISETAANITESGAKLCGFKAGDKITLEALLNALLVYSGNDAGIAIAEHLAGSEEAFGKMMTEEVKKLGAVHSNFTNSHGLHDDNHYTTVYDIYLVFQELLKYPEFKKVINQKSYNMVYESKDGEPLEAVLRNTNRYLIGTAKAPEGFSVFGGKTGTTRMAGSCLVIYSTDDKNNDYISIVLKATSSTELYKEMTHLLKLADNEKNS